MAQIALINSGADATIVQADPMACSFSIATPMGDDFSPGFGTLSVNANYFFQNQPIGVMVQAGQVVPHFIPLPAGKPRTALVLRDGTAEFTEPLSAADVDAALSSGEWSAATVIQAGPRLLRAGQIVRGDAENFAGSGALAESKHVGIGITDAGKLLFVYVADSFPAGLASLLADAGAVDAMKVDGGHAAYLRFDPTHRGAPNPFTALIVTPLGD
jgi:hypothetical protein